MALSAARGPKGITIMIWRWGVAASFAWAITGANAGAHLAVAPVTLTYQECVEKSEDRHCLTGLRRDWPAYSSDRVTYALMVAAIPIPIGWLLGCALFARIGAAGRRCRKGAEVTA
jgi:hypothetical protein